jgi:uncharacterized membrane protein
MDSAWISSHSGVLAVLGAVTSFFFYLEKRTGWKLFNYIPPLLFIYLVPVLLSNTSIIPSKSPVYDFMGDNILPFFLAVMLLKVNILATIRIMGKGIFVMLLGTLGVVLGAPLAYALVASHLGPDAWKAFGALAGSWIGGTGNMLAVTQMVELDESSIEFGYAVIADNAVYLVWLPIMLGSKNLAGVFNRFTRVSDERLQRMEAAAAELTADKGNIEMRHILYLVFLGFAVTALSIWISGIIPPVTTSTGQTIISAGTWKILVVTALGIGLSFTRANSIPGSHAISMACVYLFVARMGAKADLSGIGVEVLWFLLGAYLWIALHGAVILLGARLFRVDVHTAAISSAANIGGAASAPIVAAYHKPALVPVSILMALIGYAVGNPAAFLAALLCRWVGG